jgi:hypothetical protein
MKISKIVGLGLLVAGGVASGAISGDPARVTRDTELHADFQSDSATLAELPVDMRVEVLQRHGAWSQVKAQGKTGWVRMTALDMNTGSGSGGSLNLAAATGRTSGSVTETNAVKGLGAAIEGANPNPEALNRMQANAVPPAQGQNWAKKQGVRSTSVAYLNKPAG